jgi:hypothetical protein
MSPRILQPVVTIGRNLDRANKRMELVALLILIALIALVGGIVEESAETH